MNPIRQRLASLTAALAALCLLALAMTPATPACAAPDGYTATVHAAAQYQTFEGWGTSLCWFAHSLGGAPDPVRNHYADLLFDPVRGLGLTVVRYNIGGGESPAYPEHMEARARVPGYQPREGVWDWTADAEQRWFLHAAMERGADQLEAFSNSPPWWMTVSGSVTGSRDGVSDNLDPRYNETFAEYLAAVEHHFRTIWGVEFRDVEPLNEPLGNWWKFANRQEGCHFSRPAQNAAIKSLGAALARQGSPATVSASDENTIDEAVGSMRAYDPTALGYLDKVNTHTYGGRQRTELAALAATAKKALWVSEYGDGDASGITLSERILADMRLMRPTAWVYWQAIEPGTNGWGLLNADFAHPADLTGLRVNQKYWIMANYSRFIRPGFRFVEIDDPQSLAAYDPAARRLVIVTTNGADTEKSVTYDLSQFAAVGPAAVWRTSATEKLAELPPIPLVTGRFTAVSPPRSVTTYVVAGVEYPPAGSPAMDASSRAFDYQGAWHESRAGGASRPEHASGERNATCTVRFDGTQMLVYGSRGPDRGIAAFSIDGGAENEVDLYAASDAHGVEIYGSPTLPRGPHVLKVRVTGRRRSISSSVAVGLSHAVVVKAGDSRA